MSEEKPTATPDLVERRKSDAPLDDIDRSYAASLADAVANCRVTCKHEPSAFDLEQQGYDTIVRALRFFARSASGATSRDGYLQGMEDGRKLAAMEAAPDMEKLLGEFEKLLLDANDEQLPRKAALPITKRLNEVRAMLLSFTPSATEPGSALYAMAQALLRAHDETKYGHLIRAGLYAAEIERARDVLGITDSCAPNMENTGNPTGDYPTSTRSKK